MFGGIRINTDGNRPTTDGGLFHERKCSHGMSPNWWWEGVRAWSGPIGRCKCCGAEFGYIDSASYGNEGGKGQYHDTDLCDRCGGKYHQWNTFPAGHALNPAPKAERSDARESSSGPIPDSLGNTPATPPEAQAGEAP